MIDHSFGVQLRSIDSNHLDRLREWRNHPAIWKWCRQTDPISDVNQAAWFNRQAGSDHIKMYSIWDKDEMVGVCGLTSIDATNRRAEFSLYIAPKWHGNGLGTKALKTLLSHAFKTLNLNCVWGETFQGNPAAQLFEKIGMKKEGTRREFYFRDGRYIDCHLFSILAREWNRLLLPGTMDSQDISGNFVDCADEVYPPNAYREYYGSVPSPQDIA